MHTARALYIGHSGVALMNGDFVTAQAEHFAKRVLRKAPPEGDGAYTAKVRYAFRLAFGREPTAAELRLVSVISGSSKEALLRLEFTEQRYGRSSDYAIR